VSISATTRALSLRHQEEGQYQKEIEGPQVLFAVNLAPREIAGDGDLPARLISPSS
jgi:hypothetical protein